MLATDGGVQRVAVPNAISKAMKLFSKEDRDPQYEFKLQHPSYLPPVDL